jgi:excisionase family DNA binding protein
MRVRTKESHDDQDQLDPVLHAARSARLGEELVDRRVERRLAELGRDDWLPIPEVARLLGCSPAAARERIRRGTLPASRLSRHLYVKRSDINEALEAKRR